MKLHQGKWIAETADEIVYQRKLACFFWLTEWTDISLGVHVDIKSPNIEIHLPFGFVKIGWEVRAVNCLKAPMDKKRAYGFYYH